MNYEESLEFIESTYKFGEKIGLENITLLLDALGNPHRKLKYVHVAGTNGKGSTCTMLSKVLLESGYKVGLYTSPYLERYNYLDWKRMEYIFDVNTLGPVYMYTKYINHLNGRPGYLCYTVSCIGIMCLPGYALYTATKFGLRGFQQAIRHEQPDNLKITCLYPVGTDTNFWNAASDGVEIERAWPVMKAKTIARKMVRGMQSYRKQIYPLCWEVVYPMMVICPPARDIFWKLERDKFLRNEVKMNAVKAKKN